MESQTSTLVARALCPDQRLTIRHCVDLEGISRPFDTQNTLSWGATVRDISAGGLGLLVCYPFRVGTYIAIDLKGVDGKLHCVMARVAHVRDQMDGTWHVGCEFAQSLADDELDRLL